MENTIYLDSHATTRVDHQVLETMLPFFTEYYGNGNHRAGWKTASAVAAARFQVAELINARPSELTFASGATEAINIALKGLAAADKTGRKHIVTQRTEHSAVLRTMEQLERQGYRLTVLNVDAVGRINLEELRAVVTEDTLVVAIMLANNEIGTVQPVQEIGALCWERGARFFCDITQGLGWYPIDVDQLNIDLAAMSAHKIYGPRGVGALYARRSGRRVQLCPLTQGGGQERGLRPGTLNVPSIVGFGKAAELMNNTAAVIFTRIEQLRDRLQKELLKAFEGITIHGCVERHPGNLNLSIPGISGEDLIGALPQLVFSTGSACTSGSAQPSYVIAATGVGEEALQGAFRLGIGKYNTEAEIDLVTQAIIEQVKTLWMKRGKSNLVAEAAR